MSRDNFLRILPWYTVLALSSIALIFVLFENGTAWMVVLLIAFAISFTRMCVYWFDGL